MGFRNIFEKTVSFSTEVTVINRESILKQQEAEFCKSWFHVKIYGEKEEKDDVVLILGELFWSWS